MSAGHVSGERLRLAADGPAAAPAIAQLTTRPEAELVSVPLHDRPELRGVLQTNRLPQDRRAILGGEPGDEVYPVELAQAKPRALVRRSVPPTGVQDVDGACARRGADGDLGLLGPVGVRLEHGPVLGQLVG